MQFPKSDVVASSPVFFLKRLGASEFCGAAVGHWVGGELGFPRSLGGCAVARRGRRLTLGVVRCRRGGWRLWSAVVILRGRRGTEFRGR
eukprot:11115032-Alexandrium_andersonii.AAC.1